MNSPIIDKNENPQKRKMLNFQHKIKKHTPNCKQNLQNPSLKKNRAYLYISLLNEKKSYKI